MKRTQWPEWQALDDYANDVKAKGFKVMQQRNMENASLHMKLDSGMEADFRSAPISEKGVNLLLDLAHKSGLEAQKDDLFAGAPVNNTEGRAVLHMALRGANSDGYKADGAPVSDQVQAVKAAFLSFAENVRSGTWTGVTGEAITDVVNIGIGGSDLGPYMVCEALKGYMAGGPRVHFVSNVDGAHLHDTLAALQAKTTLFIITSKTFTTQETLLNARSAKEWTTAQLGHDEAVVKRHFAAVSTNKDAVSAFGIDTDNMFPFWDWVGGRFSLWSSVGLSIAMAVGAAHFEDLLAGAAQMDHHFKTAPLAQNIPVMAGLMGVYYRNFLGCSSLAILPYAQRLHLLPLYLQQLDMESNGKSRDRDGHQIDHATSPVIFGQAGTNGQHAFYQMLHQGGDVIPCDFIGFRRSDTDAAHHKILNAHLKAQIEALREGQDYDAALKRHDQNELKARHSVFSGGRPAHLYLFESLTPYNLGMLLALYEHKIFVQGTIWGLNSFDQWGVQLGKDLAQKYA